MEIIVFGEDWGAHPSSTQHLIKRLMPHHQIMWMNSLGLRRPKFTARDAKRAYRKLKNMFCKKQKGRDGLVTGDYPPIIHPRALSWPGNPLVGRLNRVLLGRQIDQIIRDHNFDMPIFWASMPSAIDAIDNYPNHKVVYYVGDDFRALAGVDHRPVEAMEARLADRADLIIVASTALQNRFPAEKTILIEHGVDYDLFATDAPRALDLPDHPHIAGFYGSIHDWIDLDLIAQAVQGCPEWEFVFVGDIHVDVTALKSIKNIHFLGARAHSDLPKYAQHWTVSLLPFKDCEQIRACNPLKLREYLSAGRSVVTTEFPAMQPYRDHVHVMHDAQNLIEILNNFQGQSLPRVPLEVMQNETWDHKARGVEHALFSV